MRSSGALPRSVWSGYTCTRRRFQRATSLTLVPSLGSLFWLSLPSCCRAELSAMPDIDGFLVGGASLKPEFAEIVAAIAKTV